MAVISNKLRKFAVAKCQSLKEILTVSQNIFASVFHFPPFKSHSRDYCGL